MPAVHCHGPRHHNTISKTNICLVGSSRSITTKCQHWILVSYACVVYSCLKDLSWCLEYFGRKPILHLLEEELCNFIEILQFRKRTHVPSLNIYKISRPTSVLFLPWMHHLILMKCLFESWMALTHNIKKSPVPSRQGNLMLLLISCLKTYLIIRPNWTLQRKTPYSLPPPLWRLPLLQPLANHAVLLVEGTQAFLARVLVCPDHSWINHGPAHCRHGLLGQIFNTHPRDHDLTLASVNYAARKVIPAITILPTL